MRALHEAIWEDAPADPEPWGLRWRAALLCDAVGAGDRVLDVGCGAGRFCALAAQAGAGEVVGVDVAPSALQRAASVAPTASLRLAEADGELPVRDRSIDLLWCSEVLAHVGDTAVLLSELRRVLAPGGRLLLTTPAHDRLRVTVTAAVAFERHFNPLGPTLRFHTRRGLARLLGESGLQDVRVRGHGGLPLARETLIAQAVRQDRASPGVR